MIKEDLIFYYSLITTSRASSKNKEMKKPKVVIKKPTYKGFSIVTSLE